MSFVDIQPHEPEILRQFRALTPGEREQVLALIASFGRTPDTSPYADKTLRPGLNKPTEALNEDAPDV